MTTFNDFQSNVDPVLTNQSQVIAILERIARAQEGMLAIAAEARAARLELSAQLQAK